VLFRKVARYCGFIGCNVIFKLLTGIEKMKKIRLFLCVLMFVFFSAISFCFTVAQNKVDDKLPKLPTYTATKLKNINARFIVTIIPDNNGGAWIGTEDDGVIHYEKDKAPTHFSTKVYDPNAITDRLPDNNAYALAADKLGRLWIGHLNAGVTIFYNNKLKYYDIVDGPIGERIFDIEVCPVDGDVWLATCAGITRYRQKQDTWQHFTKANGLPEAQIEAIAFKNDGTLIAGTQCYGISIFNRDKKGEYKLSQNISAPHRFGNNKRSSTPLTCMGNGLPSNQINDIIVTKNSPNKEQLIWIATSAGLVSSNLNFTNINYWRGKNYSDKIHGLYGGTPKDFKQEKQEILNLLPPDDYITTLAEDNNGNLIYGTRSNGLVIYNPKTNTRIFCNNKSAKLPDNYITAICHLPNEQYLIGSYGGGIILLQKSETKITDTSSDANSETNSEPNIAHNNTANNSENVTSFPSPQKALTADEIQKLSYSLGSKAKSCRCIMPRIGRTIIKPKAIGSAEFQTNGESFVQCPHRLTDMFIIAVIFMTLQDLSDFIITPTMIFGVGFTN
jgi:hypothetical protein